MTASGIKIHNGGAVALSKVPTLAMERFRQEVIDSVERGNRISALFAMPQGTRLELVAVMAHDRHGTLSVARTAIDGSYPALTPDCTAAHLFERQIAEQWGIVPQGHPWLKPVRFHHAYGNGDARGRQIAPSVMDFFAVQGADVHEVAVGPVHAGIIEPGHFRFQCSGEQVLNLEISLGYQHRGAEKAMAAGPDKRTVHYAQTLAGDTTIGHTTAYCQLAESLADTDAPPRAQTIRSIALELERLANHTGDLGALAGDIGYLPTASFCGRIRGDFLNMTAIVCGNRFGRGLLRPGGVEFDIDERQAAELDAALERGLKDVSMAADLLWQNPSVMARLEGTGTVPVEMCMELGLVGPVARACGLERDIRFDLPAGKEI